MSAHTSAPVAIRTLHRGDAHTRHSGGPDPGLFVVRDQAGWTSLWARMTNGCEPAPDAPEVRWGSEVVVALILGWRPTTGYHVEIEQVTVVDGVLHVHAREERPGGIAGDMNTYPVHAVAAPSAAVDELLLIQRITTTDEE